MKKVLLAGTALVGAALLASPAQADLKLDLGGYFRGYAVYADNDEAAGTSLREFDLRRNAEVHFSGETTFDNGLTVGVHAEEVLGDETDLSQTDEVYAYFSGQWGRVNLGSEDGAAYLLQVAAPSADSNVDGLRTYIQALNPRTAVSAGATGLQWNGVLDYDHADFQNTDRFTYLTPKFNGFQAGFSYAPESGQNSLTNNTAGMAVDNNAFTDAFDDYEDLWEVAARWDGEFSGFGLSLGAGWSSADIEADQGVLLNHTVDGLETWNVGASATFNSFSVGGAYKRSETQSISNAVGPVVDDVEMDTWAAGAGWDNGPYHLGVSYLNNEIDRSSAAAAFNYEDDRWTVGGGYTFGPGATFRGAVAFGEFDRGGGAANNDFTQVTFGTDLQF